MKKIGPGGFEGGRLKNEENWTGWVWGGGVYYVYPPLLLC